MKAFIDRRRFAGVAAALLCFALGVSLPRNADAQSIDGAGVIVIIPVVVSSGSFATHVSVYNPSPFGLTATVQITYFGAPGTTAPGQQQVAAACRCPRGIAREFDFQTQCGLPAPTGGRFGLLQLISDPTTVGVVPIVAFSRVSTPQGIGFSVEAFPVGTFEGGAQDVIGLKRQAATPGYQTNCFVAALAEDVPGYTVKLFNSVGTQIGSTITHSTLAAHAMVRYIDIFTAAGLASGDFLGVRAEFVNTDATANGPGQQIVAFCTVQDSVSFGADFRIAKVMQPRDESRLRYAVSGSNSIPNATTKQRYLVFARQPDVVQCFLVNPGGTNYVPDLEIAMFIPGAPSILPNGGGNNVNFITPDIGERGTYPQFPGVYGRATYYFVEVSPREGLALPPPFPWNYELECNAGNGVATPVLLGNFTDNF